MNTRLLIAAAGVSSAASAVSAQYTAQYSLIFWSPTAAAGNGTANITLPVGLPSVVTAHVMVSFNPGVGQPYGFHGTLTGTITGLESGGYDLSGSGPVGLGAWVPPTPASLQFPYNFFFGTSPGTVAGYSINNALWGTGSPFPPIHQSPENPDNVVTYTFTTTGTAGVINFSFPGGAGGFSNTGVWVLGTNPFPFVGQFITSSGPGGSITIIPAPASLALLGLGALVALRRGR